MKRKSKGKIYYAYSKDEDSSVFANKIDSSFIININKKYWSLKQKLVLIFEQHWTFHLRNWKKLDQEVIPFFDISNKKLSLQNPNNICDFLENLTNTIATKDWCWFPLETFLHIAQVCNRTIENMHFPDIQAGDSRKKPKCILHVKPTHKILKLFYKLC